MKTKAFTLLELLVVISIIAILVSLLFPAARTLQLRGQQVSSMNNLRQWGTGLANSLGDWNGTMPWDGAKDNAGELDLEAPDAWYNRIPQYMGMPSLKELTVTDPNDIKQTLPKPGRKSVWMNPAVPASAADGRFSPPRRFFFAYAVNCYLSGEDGVRSEYRNLPLQMVKHPSRTVLMAEKADQIPNASPRYVAAFFGGAARDARNLPTEDETNAANFLFCDGHVQLVERRVFAAASASDNQLQDPVFTFVPFEGARSSRSR